MSAFDTVYHNLLTYVLARGDRRETRNGPVLSVFGYQMCFDLTEGFPLLTTKRLHTKSIVAELSWMLRGDTNVAFLHEHGCSIWDEWADEHGDLGPVYGKQWRSWLAERGNEWSSSVDQIKNVVETLRDDPYGRRHLVSAWNVADIDDMALPPCHCLFQFYVRDGHLDCQLYQRSADIFLGVPFNIASYALLTELVARTVGLKAGRFIHILGDAHVYENHVEQAAVQLCRTSREAPTLVIAEQFNLLKLDPRHVHFMNYDPHPAIPAPVSA